MNAASNLQKREAEARIGLLACTPAPSRATVVSRFGLNKMRHGGRYLVYVLVEGGWRAGWRRRGHVMLVMAAISDMGGKAVLVGNGNVVEKRIT